MRTDPYANFRFLVECGSEIKAGFSECSGLASKIAVIEYQEGGDMTSVRKLPGKTSYPDITLKWGLTDNRDLYDWHMRAVNGQIERLGCSIVVLGDDLEEKVRWDLSEAWPSAWTGPSFNAKSSDVAIEQLVITCERVERVK
jgi:phage tail-like protein